MESLKKIYAILDRWKGSYLFAGALLSFSALMRMIEPKALQLAIDGVRYYLSESATPLPAGDAPTRALYRLLPTLDQKTPHLLSNFLLGVAILYAFFALIRAGAWFWSGRTSAAATENAIKLYRDRVFNHIQRLSLKAFDAIPTSEMIQRSTGDIGTIREFIGTQITEVILLTSYFVFAFAMMLTVHVLYAFIAVAIVPVIVFLAVKFFIKEGAVWEAHEKEQDKLTAIVNENLAGARVVQAFMRQDYEIEKFTKQNQAKLKIALQHVNLHKWFWTYSDFLIQLQVAASMMAGAYFTLRGEITPGEFVAFFTYSSMVAWPLRQVGRTLTQAGMSFVAIQRLSEIMDAEEENYEGFQPEGALRGEIEFRNVSFRYKEGEPLALDAASFHIQLGEKVALIGMTGAGKSTIVALLARFYEPTEGTIYLDGRPLNTYDKTALRKRIGIVHQKPFLFSTTIRDNIAFSQIDAEDVAVHEAAGMAAVDAFLHKTPKGYETMVGEKGVTLSGGQKQRVALARTVLSNPDILIMDDTTSAVDTETELHIQTAMSKTRHGKTTLIIAYRVNSVQDADKIIVLDKGKITELGAPSELLERDGFYRKIYNIQSAIEQDLLA